tara:strand:- start:2442 stop:3641 length:1200 start_codon:yes stop_codon:yes gene_type:complete
LKKVAVFTGNRAEFGLQLPLLKELDKSSNIDLTLLIGASHIDEEFGLTIKEVEDYGFHSNYLIDFKHDSDNLDSNSITISKGISLVTDALAEIKPDLFIVYADRYEGFAALIASTQMGIITAHFEGGDITEGGTFDDSVRHAMTKLAHIHFTTNEDATKRILQLGEPKENIFTVGLPSVDLIKAGEFSDESELVKRYKLENVNNIIVFTQHPIPIEKDNISKEFEAIENALINLELTNFKIICTYPNSDIGGKEIIKILKRWEKAYEFIDVYESLGRKDFHGLLNLNNTSSEIRSCYLGNSSAGVKETPALKCPSIIIGNRQKGRLHSTNVIFVEENKEQISNAISLVFNDDEFINICQETINPYGDGSMGKKSLKIIENLKLNEKLLKKSFKDIDFMY